MRALHNDVMMKTIIILIRISLIFVCGRIESNQGTGNEEINKIENKNLSWPNKSDVPGESEYKPNVKNQTNEGKIEANNESEVANEQEPTNKSEINNFSYKSAIENFTNNNSSNKSDFTSKTAPKPEIKKIKFDIYGLNCNRDAQELESKLQHHVGEIIYTRTSFSDEDGEVVYDTSKITREEVINKASFIASPGTTVVWSFRITFTEEINCTQKNNEYYCCSGAECSIYKK